MYGVGLIRLLWWEYPSVNLSAYVPLPISHFRPSFPAAIDRGNCCDHSGWSDHRLGFGIGLTRLRLPTKEPLQVSCGLTLQAPEKGRKDSGCTKGSADYLKGLTSTRSPSIKSSVVSQFLYDKAAQPECFDSSYHWSDCTWFVPSALQ